MMRAVRKVEGERGEVVSEEAYERVVERERDAR